MKKFCLPMLLIILTASHSEAESYLVGAEDTYSIKATFLENSYIRFEKCQTREPSKCATVGEKGETRIGGQDFSISEIEMNLRSFDENKLSDYSRSLAIGAATGASGGAAYGAAIGTVWLGVGAGPGAAAGGLIGGVSTTITAALVEYYYRKHISLLPQLLQDHSIAAAEGKLNNIIADFGKFLASGKRNLGEQGTKITPVLVDPKSGKTWSQPILAHDGSDQLDYKDVKRVLNLIEKNSTGWRLPTDEEIKDAIEHLHLANLSEGWNQWNPNGDAIAHYRWLKAGREDFSFSRSASFWAGPIEAGLSGGPAVADFSIPWYVKRPRIVSVWEMRNLTKKLSIEEIDALDRKIKNSILPESEECIILTRQLEEESASSGLKISTLKYGEQNFRAKVMLLLVKDP